MASINIFQLLSKCGPVYDKQSKQQKPISQLNCKFFGLLFTADWCRGCVLLQKKLPDLMKKVDPTQEQFKVITIRVDNSSSKFAENYFYFHKMLPEKAQGLQNYFKVKSLPTMIFYSMKGRMVSLNGVQDMQKFRQRTLQLWGSI